MDNRLPNRRNLLEAAQKYLLDPSEEQLDKAAGAPPRLTSQAIQQVRMSRSRERILANIDDMYREAFERAKATGDDAQMATLDFAYRREQLYFEILLDVRDAIERK
jgi:ribosomal protein L16 Arg81 hydroxylase